jgi:hypothetical protein
VAIFEPAREAEPLEALTFCVDFAEDALDAGFDAAERFADAPFFDLAADFSADDFTEDFAAGFALAAGRDFGAALLVGRLEPDFDAARVAADFVALAITHSRVFFEPKTNTMRDFLAE